jgi:hypothetical protein
MLSSAQIRKDLTSRREKYNSYEDQQFFEEHHLNYHRLFTHYMDDEKMVVALDGNFQIRRRNMKKDGKDGNRVPTKPEVNNFSAFLKLVRKI